jgi:hypothetical protein
MTTKPNSFLPPNSQLWGRWVETTLNSILAVRQKAEQDIANALRQLNIAIPQPMRGMLWNQTGTTVTITTAGVYVPLNLAGTLDTDGTFNMVAGTVNSSGLKNDTNQARTLVFIATYDGKAGNNNAIGLKLALNGVPIDATECRSFAGGGGQVGKTFTQFTLRMQPDDEVSMWVSGINGTTDLTVERYKLLAHAIL